MAVVELFFDYSSPWTYLAFSQVPKLMEETGASIIFKPILVGGVFNKVNTAYYEFRESARAKPSMPKLQYMSKDFDEWADAYGLQILSPYAKDPSKRVKPFPVNSVKSLRGKFQILLL